MTKKTSHTGTVPQNFILRHAHHVLLGILICFVLAALLLGEVLNAYEALWWWDDMLHGMSGVIFGVIGLFLVYGINKRTDMRITPLFVALFVFCFAITMGVMWEICEFSADFFFKTTMQQWDMSKNAIVIGRDYQGMGLRDTMSDLIVATIGAVVAATFSFVAFSHNRRIVAGVMRNSLSAVEK